MDKKVKVLFFSKTGISETYANLIADNLGQKAENIKAFNKSDLVNLDTLIYVAPVNAGIIRKLRKVEKISQKNHIKNLVIILVLYKIQLEIKK